MGISLRIVVEHKTNTDRSISTMNGTHGLNPSLQQYSAFPPSATAAAPTAFSSNTTTTTINDSSSITTQSAYREYFNATNSPHILFQPVYLTYLWLALIIGLPGNLLISAVYVTIKQKRTSDWFIFFLAVYDCAVCVFAVPLYLSIETGVWLSTGSDVACKLEQFIIHASQLSSVSILSIIAVDRFLKICHPTKRSLNAQQARNIGLWTPVISGLAATPILMWEGNVDQRTCMVQDRYKNNWGVKAFVFLTFIFFVCMFTVVTYCYAKVIVVVKRRARRHKENTLKRKHLMEIPDFLRAISSVEETKKSQRKARRSRRKFSLFSFTSSRRLSVISPWSKARLSLPNENSSDLKESHEMNEIEKRATRESLTESKKLLDKALSAKSGLDARSIHSDKERGAMRGERTASIGSRSKGSRCSTRPRLMGTCSVVSIDEQDINKSLTHKEPSNNSLVINVNIEDTSSKESLNMNRNANENDFKSVSNTNIAVKGGMGMRETKSKNSLVLNVNDIVGGLSAGRPSRRRSHALGVSDAYTQSWTQKHDALWSEQLKRARSNPNALIPRDTSDEFKGLAVSRVSMVEPEITDFDLGMPSLPCSHDKTSDDPLHSHPGDRRKESSGDCRNGKSENMNGARGKSKKKSKKKSAQSVCERNPSISVNDNVKSTHVCVENVDIHQSTNNHDGDYGAKNGNTVIEDGSTYARKTPFARGQLGSELIMSDDNTLSELHISGHSPCHPPSVGDRSSCRLLSLPEALRMSRHSCDDNEENATESTSFLQEELIDRARRKNSEPGLKSRTKKLRKYFSFTSTSSSNKGAGESSESRVLYRTLRSIHNSIKRRRSKGKKSSLTCDIEMEGGRVEDTKEGRNLRNNENDGGTNDTNKGLEEFDYEDEREERTEVTEIENREDENNRKPEEEDEDEEELIRLFGDDVDETNPLKHKTECDCKRDECFDDRVGHGRLCADCTLVNTDLAYQSQPGVTLIQSMSGVNEGTPHISDSLVIATSNDPLDKRLTNTEQQHHCDDDRRHCHHRQQQSHHHHHCNHHPLSSCLSDRMENHNSNDSTFGESLSVVEANKSNDRNGGFVGVQWTGTSDDGGVGGLAMFLVPRDCGKGKCVGGSGGATADGAFDGREDNSEWCNIRDGCGIGGSDCVVSRDIDTSNGDIREVKQSNSCIYGCNKTRSAGNLDNHCSGGNDVANSGRVDSKSGGTVQIVDGSDNGAWKYGSTDHQYNDHLDQTSCDKSISQNPKQATCTVDTAALTPHPWGNHGDNSAPPDRPGSMNKGKLLVHENNGHPSRYITLGDPVGKSGRYGATACQPLEWNRDQAFNVVHQNERGFPVLKKCVRPDGDMRRLELRNSNDNGFQIERIAPNQNSCHLEKGYSSQTYPPSKYRHPRRGGGASVHGRCDQSCQCYQSRRDSVLDDLRIYNIENHDAATQLLRKTKSLCSDNQLSLKYPPANYLPWHQLHHYHHHQDCATNTNKHCEVFPKHHLLNPRIKLAITKQRCPFHVCNTYDRLNLSRAYLCRNSSPNILSNYLTNRFDPLRCHTCTSFRDTEFYINLQQLLCVYNPLSTTSKTTSTPTSTDFLSYVADEQFPCESNSQSSKSYSNPNNKSQHGFGDHVTGGSRSYGPERIPLESDSIKSSFNPKSQIKDTKHNYNFLIDNQQITLPQIDPNNTFSIDQIRTKKYWNQYHKQPISILFHEKEFEFHNYCSMSPSELFNQNPLGQDLAFKQAMSSLHQIAIFDIFSHHNQNRTENINNTFIIEFMNYIHAASQILPILLSTVCQGACANYVIQGCQMGTIAQSIPVWSVGCANPLRKFPTLPVDRTFVWDTARDINTLSRDTYLTFPECALSPCHRDDNTASDGNKVIACVMSTNEPSAVHGSTLNSLTFILAAIDAGMTFSSEIDIINQQLWMYFCRIYKINSETTSNDSENQNIRLPYACTPSYEPDDKIVKSPERGGQSSSRSIGHTVVNKHGCVDRGRISISKEHDTFEKNNQGISAWGKDNNGEISANDMKIGGFRNIEEEMEGSADNSNAGIILNRNSRLDESKVCDPADICIISLDTKRKEAGGCLEKSFSETLEKDTCLPTPSTTTHQLKDLHSDSLQHSQEHGCAPYVAESTQPSINHFDGSCKSKTVPSEFHMSDSDPRHAVTEPRHVNTINSMETRQNTSTLLLSVPLPGQFITSSQSQIDHDTTTQSNDIIGNRHVNIVPSLLVSQTDPNTTQPHKDPGDTFPPNEDLHLLNVGKQKKRASSWCVSGAQTSNVQRFTPFDKIHSSLLGCLPSITVGSSPEKGSMPALHVPPANEDTCQIFARSVIGAFFSSGKSSCASDPCLQLNDEDDLDGIKVTTPSTEEILEAMKRSEEYMATACLGDNLRAGGSNNDLGSFPNRRHSSFQTYCKTIGRFGRLARRANGRITHSWYSLDDLQDNSPGKIPSRSVTKLAYLATIGSQIQEAFSMKNVKRVFSTNLFKSLSRHLDHIPGTRKPFPRGQAQYHTQGQGDSPMTCNHIDVIITRCESIVMDGSQVSLDRSNSFGCNFETHHSTEDNQTDVHTSNESSATNTTTHNQHQNMTHPMRASHSFASGADTPISSLSRSDDQSLISRSHDTSIDRLRGVSLDLLSPMSASVRGSVCSGLSSLSKATECSAYTENSRSDCEKITRRSAEREHNITKLLGVITLIFVVSWSVSWSVNLMYLADAITDTPANHVILSLGQNMFLMNHFCNIFFYTFFSKSFREKLTNFYNERSKKCHQQDNNPSVTSRSVKN